MLDTVDAALEAAWDARFDALFTETLGAPADLLTRVVALPARPGKDGATLRDRAVSRIVVGLVNTRFYVVAAELAAAEAIRPRIARLLADGGLTQPEDRDAMFALAVLDTQKSGDPARGLADFQRLRALLPPDHHLQQACADGENAATTMVGRKTETVAAPAAPEGFAARLLLRLGLAKPKARTVADIRFIDFSADPNEQLLPWLDRSDVDETKLSPEQLSWRRDGVVVLRNFFPPHLTDAYVARRAALANASGWRSPTPYQHVPEMRALALYPPLMELQKQLLGEDMLLHLALTGWISTERNWHQDDYLNPSEVLTWYTAVWMALDTIDPDCGPFEYIPGSHRWPLMSGERVRALMTQEERDRREGPHGVNHWATYSERFVAPAIDAEIRARDMAPVQFLGGKGDVLIWHSRLMHRGTAPRRPNLERRSLITHYSGVHHRTDMADRAVDEHGQSYALFETALH